jgi:DNA mismatch endonuclease, patch repair protein
MFSKERRSEIMRCITGKNTQPELRVRRVLHRMGYRFRLNHSDMPGRPDIVLRRWKTVIFVHGCFWHGHGCKRGSKSRRPKSNVRYWNAKIEGNVARDKRNRRLLARLGWRCFVIWDCQTRNDVRLEARIRSIFDPKVGVATKG